MPKLQASRKHGISRQTLQFRLSKKFKRIGHGPSSYLTEEEEDVLQKWIMESYRKGFPQRRHDIQTSVKSFLDDNPRKNPFKNNIPGKHWYRAFLRRHPEIAIRTPEGVTTSSSNVSESDIRSWFNGIEAYLKENNYFRVLQSPARVYNADESGFVLCPQAALYPNATRILQPADVACFKPLKNAWKVEVLKWRTNNPYLQLTKLHFAPILKEALLSLKKPSIINGFRACGLYPWNVESVNFSECLGKKHQTSNLTVTTQNDQFSSLSYDVFSNTVGLDKLRSLENYCNTEEVSEDFKLLFKIYQKLQDSTKHKVPEVAEGDIDDSIIRVDTDITQYDIENIPILI
nr:unnamed protein product [Callosobruchus analis]